MTLIGYFAGDVGIDIVDGGDVNVVVADGRIIVEGAEGETVRVYDMMGRMVASVAAGTAVRVPDSGVYLVKVGEAAAEKVFVIR